MVTFLNPCCGTGKYLLTAAKHFDLKPENVYGFDIDPHAVIIAKMNLLLLYDNDFEPNIKCMDTISVLGIRKLFQADDGMTNRFDLVATNPPWGASKNVTYNIDSIVKSGETFSYFIERAMKMLRPRGVMSVIVPQAILNVKVHADIRKFLLAYKIKNIVMLGRPFTNVFSQVVRLDVVKAKARPKSVVMITGTKTFGVPQNRFNRNKDYTFDVEVDDDTARLISKIYSVKHNTLKNNAVWALGIVTGNNEKFVVAAGKNTEPVLRGPDLEKFKITKPKSHIVFEPQSFQQVAEIGLYRQEKLVYKAISSKLVFAYDRKHRLTLNSANVVIPKICGISMLVALAFLNSNVFQFLFTKKYNAIKVLRHSLESLPFPVLTDKQHLKIETLVKARLCGKEVDTDINEEIYKIFKLNLNDIRVIENMHDTAKKRH